MQRRENETQAQLEETKARLEEAHSQLLAQQEQSQQGEEWEPHVTFYKE